MAEPAVVVDGLTVTYGDLVAVDDIGFSAPSAAVTALLGPNGAGKTTTIETLEGYRAPERGSVRVLGLDPLADHAELTRRVGIMLQDGGIHPGMRPHEVVRLFAAYHDRPLDPTALVERVGLAGRTTTVRRLSGGERQRLSLALALVGRPELVVLDEPTAGLDLEGRHLVRELLGELIEGGTTILLATHDLAEADKVADHTVIIDRGRVIASGTPVELAAASGHDDVRFRAAPGLDTLALAASLGAAVSTPRPGEYVVAAAGSPRLLAALTGWLADRDIDLQDLQAGRPGLEELFARLTTTTDEVEG